MGSEYLVVTLPLSACAYGIWRCVVDLLEGVVKASRLGVGCRRSGGSVNSPPCAKSRHAGAAHCAVLTLPAKLLLTFPGSAGGCGSQR